MRGGRGANTTSSAPNPSQASPALLAACPSSPEALRLYYTETRRIQLFNNLLEWKWNDPDNLSPIIHDGYPLACTHLGLEGFREAKGIAYNFGD